MLGLTELELQNICRPSEGFTLRDTIYTAESTGGEYVYKYTELWSTGTHVIKAVIRRAKYPEYSFAGTYSLDLRDLPYGWHETGITLPAEQWHIKLIAYSQYGAPTEAMGLALALFEETAAQLGL